MGLSLQTGPVVCLTQQDPVEPGMLISGCEIAKPECRMVTVIIYQFSYALLLMFKEHWEQADAFVTVRAFSVVSTVIVSANGKVK